MTPLLEALQLILGLTIIVVLFGGAVVGTTGMVRELLAEPPVMVRCRRCGVTGRRHPHAEWVERKPR
jgi:hypothetical protein